METEETLGEVPAYFYEQSAVIPYRKRDGEWETLLITSRKRTRWVVPKGVVDPGSTPAQSALREAMEEAGIAGRIHPEPVGEYRYEKWSGICHVTVFVMEVEEMREEWPESYRERLWLDHAIAAELMDEEALKQMIRDLPRWLARPNP
ncbi:MAG: NUDIX hydrolase [Magnetococcales bacterium]|nr:NUDIX hydrolase [Magnetococcales bacterium]